MHSWSLALAWISSCTALFLWLQALIPVYIETDPSAVKEFFAQVPRELYNYSQMAFLGTLALDVVAFLFEDTSLKRQLALLSGYIKCVTWYCDYRMVHGDDVIAYDTFGTLWVPMRYLQWIVTTPTLIFILSKISNFSLAKVMLVCGSQAALLAAAYLASVAPHPLNWVVLTLAASLYPWIMHEMYNMIQDAISAHPEDTHARYGLHVTYLASMVVWAVFPTCAFLMRWQPSTHGMAERLTLLANFFSKVLFCSSLMYSNYVSIAQRRLDARLAQEHVERLRTIGELTDTIRNREQFVGLISHELRTPLNGIIQLSDMLVRGAAGPVSDRGQHFLETIRNSGNHLLNIINDIIDTAALKEGKLAIKHELVSLEELVGHVVEIVRPLAKRKVELKVMVSPQLPVMLSDGGRLTQILFNLLGNSLKFTSAGHVEVKVDATPSGEAVRLAVSDTGIGVPADKLEAIFKPFEQVDMSVSRKYGGTGLGLSIVQQLVTALGGSIKVDSKEGSGTCFLMTLPTAQPTQRRSLEAAVRVACEQRGYSWHLINAACGGAAEPSTQIRSSDDVQQALQAAVAAAAKLPQAATVAAKPPQAAAAMAGAADEPAPQHVNVLRRSREAERREQDSLAHAAVRQSSAVQTVPLDAPPPPRVTAALGSTLYAGSQGAAPQTGAGGASPAKVAGHMGEGGLSAHKPAYSSVHGVVQVMVIDDDDVNHVVLADVLQQAGYFAAHAMGGEEALAALAASTTLPDVLVLDFMMPGMSGLQFCRELRRSIPPSVLPVVMLSAVRNEAAVVEALNVGCNDFVGKPVDRVELLCSIDAQLRMKHDAAWLADLQAGGTDTAAYRLLQRVLPPDGLHAIMAAGPQQRAQHHDHIALLFAEPEAGATEAAVLAAFCAFETAAAQRGLTCVATVGRLFLAVGGHDGSAAPEEESSASNAVQRVTALAAAMLEVAPDMALRIGMHCGSAYSMQLTVGGEAPSCCFLGDTVACAFGIMQSSAPRVIQVSEALALTHPQPHTFQEVGLRTITDTTKMRTYLLKVGAWREVLASWVSKGVTAREPRLLGVPREDEAVAPRSPRTPRSCGPAATVFAHQ